MWAANTNISSGLWDCYMGNWNTHTVPLSILLENFTAFRGNDKQYLYVARRISTHTKLKREGINICINLRDVCPSHWPECTTTQESMLPIHSPKNYRIFDLAFFDQYPVHLLGECPRPSSRLQLWQREKNKKKTKSLMTSGGTESNLLILYRALPLTFSLYKLVLFTPLSTVSSVTYKVTLTATLENSNTLPGCRTSNLICQNKWRTDK